MEKSATKGKVKRSVFSFISVFLASLFAFVLCTVSVLKTTVYNREYYINILQTTKYSEYLAEDIRKELVHLGQISIEDCPEYIFNESVPSAKILNDSLDYVEACMTNSPKATDDEDLRKELTQKLNSYVVRQYPEMAEDPQIKADLELLVDSCVKAYIDSVQTDLMKLVGDITFKTSKYIDAAMVLFSVLTLLFAGLIIPINRSASKRLMYYVILCSTFLLTAAVVPAVLYGTDIVSKAAITSEYLYTFVTAVLSGVAFGFLIAAIVGAVLTLIAIIINALYKKYRIQ
ncbi:MAG: hypothetical protein IJF54_06155 [Clostridia bacterium]|nr:hypothetical protein [Clostridia bacterium]